MNTKEKLIYILDDDEMYIAFIESIIQRNGSFKIALFMNEEELFSKLKEQTPFLLVIDYHLESKNTGIDVVKKIRIKKYSFPIIMLSGSAGMQIAIDSFKYGISDFIEKDDNTAENIKIAIKNIEKSVSIKSELLKNEKDSVFHFTHIISILALCFLLWLIFMFFV